MEYKFKTIYQRKLLSCIPVESNNLIICIDLLGALEFAKIGRLREEKGWREDLPVLPIFQYTGKKDRNDEEIYCGHSGILKGTPHKLWEIEWNEHISGFRLVEREENNQIVNDMYLCPAIAKQFSITNHWSLYASKLTWRNKCQELK